MMKLKCSGKTKSGKDCKNDVSVEGETFCPTHGGETKASHEEKQKSLRKQNNQKQNQNQKQNNQKQNDQKNPKQKHTPMQKQKQNPLKKKTCEKICSTTKKQCKLFVSLKGEKFCPRHGGLTKGGVVMRVPRSPIPWAALHSACLNFVIIEHSLCKCEPRISPCKSMQIMIWLQQLSSLVSLKKSGKSTYPSVSALRKWIEKAPLDKMNFQELLLHASRTLQVANTRWLRDLLNDTRGEKEKLNESDGEGGIERESDKIEKNEGGSDGVGGNNDVEGEGEDEEEGIAENDEGEGENDEEEEELNVESKDENEKGKEEVSEVEMMDQGDDEVVEGGDEVEEEDGEQDEEEYVPSSSSVKRNVKKQKKRVKSEDDQDLNDNSSLKKTMIEEFKTQNSPAV
jgi:hypothetical protein